jgi:dihydrofolate synthase/folylpolyglutamate synthase
MTIAKKLHSPCHQTKGNFTWYDEENRATAKLALEKLDVKPTHIQEGLKALPPCRLEVIVENPLVVLDAGHNPDGLKQLFKALRHHFPGKALRVVCAFSSNKDINSCLSIIGQQANAIHLTAASHERAAPEETLATALDAMGKKYEALKNSVADTLQDAISKLRLNEEILVICGTFFILADARAFFGKQGISDQITIGETMHHRDSEIMN